ncbi:sugar ABC transporter permease [Xylanibacillus composti]|uniref:Sugar ABC transporter permease n=1 Tax=Xylanibacillus composti TaxID=1572762 RepID=A0A8J4M4F4_9BACL|nr:ABC transporter permease subunit [Xylanibacillus composti]MDT9725709.1 sugar ABC transporter permease [Xylanibacillus composti]GIQ71152.1 sugar ABC transporter permease [Xylanibacillus composti]
MIPPQTRGQRGNGSAALGGTHPAGRSLSSRWTTEWRQLKKNAELILLLLPGALYTLVFHYLPLVGIIIAFKSYRYDLGIFGSEWVGLKNFEFFFASETAWRITRNTILYNAGFIVFTTATALAFAIMLNEIGRRWVKAYQTVLFLPHFLSWVVVGYIVLAFLDHESGYLNRLLMLVGMNPQNWFYESSFWPYILNTTNLWKTVGFATLIYYAGIIGINSEYYEAARIDGASKLQMIRRITIPLLTPLIAILFILAVGNMFRGDFGLHYFVPNNSGLIYSTTDVVDTYVYRALRTLGDVSMAAAVSFFQSIVGFVLVLGANTIIKKINEENALW